MFKKKQVKREEEGMKYLIGGSVLGMAAGLFMGKLLHSSVPAIEIKEIEPGVSGNEKRIVHTQDDNIYNPLYSDKNTQYQHSRSKSASRYEGKSSKEHPSHAAPLKTFMKNPTDYSNNLSSMHKVNNLSKSEKNLIRNINAEDNFKYNLCDTNINVSTCSKHIQKQEKLNNHSLSTPISTQGHIDLSNSDNAKSIEVDTNLNVKSINSTVCRKRINTDNINIRAGKSMLKHSEISKCIQVSEECNSFNNHFYINDSTVLNSFPTKKDAHLCTLHNESENPSNFATYNSTTNFEEEEDKMLFTSTDEFLETDLISSTKQNILDDIQY